MHTAATILCCMCGVSIESNPANMCATCLQSRVDITEGIPKQITIFWCRNCGRYQRPPWVDAPLESKEMLALCLKKIKGLNKEVKLIDAAFIWTEPHSRRIKVKLTVQKEIFNSIIMQQVFVVEFVVANMQCTDCQRSFTEHTWTAVVQVRQHRKHKRTLFMLEQLLIRHNICNNVIQIKEVPDGLDFYWNTKTDALHMIDFLKSVLPIRTNQGKKLISQDDNNNTKKYKFSLLIEIAAAAREDLIMLSPKLTQQLGGVSNLMLVHRVSNAIHLVDPITLKTAELIAERYFHDNPRIVLTADQLVEYTVIDIEIIGEHDYNRPKNSYNNNKLNQGLTAFNKQNAFNAKLCLAEVTVARSSDLGINDTQFVCMTHLGRLLRAGDTCLGYDLVKHNLTEDVLSKNHNVPDVILVRKTYPKAKRRPERRQWKLKMLNKEAADRAPKKGDVERYEREMEQFMQDIEEDPELRSKINLYKRFANPQEEAEALSRIRARDARNQAMGGDEEEEDLPEIRLEELLDELQQVNIKDDEDTRDEDMDNWRVEDFTAGPSYEVQSGRGIRNMNTQAPERQGGFEDDDIEV